MSERGCVFLKAEDAGGQILGFSLTRVVADEAELLSIAVDEKHRGKGIALAMLEETLVQTKKLGAAKIFLEVAVDNDSAIGLYKKAGFKIIGKRPAYYSRGGGDTSATDAWVMGLELFLPL